jgi:predicted RNase H-like HicB family nuclease/predicted RNA binding protein YcfA (HicA-like mRNA interferase family)
VKVRDILKLLAKDGWLLKNQEGSHRQYVHPRKLGKVTVAGHMFEELDPKDEKIYTKASRPNMSRYPILIAPTRTGFSAHVPDLPGCVATGRTLQELKKRMAKAIEMHLAAMREDGDEIPEPSRVEMVNVA